MFCTAVPLAGDPCVHTVLAPGTCGHWAVGDHGHWLWSELQGAWVCTEVTLPSPAWQCPACCRARPCQHSRPSRRGHQWGCELRLPAETAMAESAWRWRWWHHGRGCTTTSEAAARHQTSLPPSPHQDTPQKWLLGGAESSSCHHRPE